MAAAAVGGPQTPTFWAFEGRLGSSDPPLNFRPSMLYSDYVDGEIPDALVFPGLR